MSGNLSEEEIDELVIAQADNDEVWEKPVFVNRRLDIRPRIVGPPEVESNKDVLNGEAVFRGTRVPVSAMIDNIESGLSLDEFLENFPSVKREQAVEVLEYFKTALTGIKRAA